MSGTTVSLDSSALAERYAQEEGSRRLLAAAREEGLRALDPVEGRESVRNL